MKDTKLKNQIAGHETVGHKTTKFLQKKIVKSVYCSYHLSIIAVVWYVRCNENVTTYNTVPFQPYIHRHCQALQFRVLHFYVLQIRVS